MPIASLRHPATLDPLVLGLSGLLLACAGCKRASPAPAPTPSREMSAQPSALPMPEEMTRCRRLPDLALTLDAPALAAKPDAAAPGEDEDDDALLPFGVDIGAALSVPTGFAVAGVRGAGQAFVALVSERGSRRIDLGELHGDVETPALAAAGERLLVGLRSTDAAGFTVKLGRVGVDGNAVEWGQELTKLGKTVTGLSLAAQGARGVLVYQGEVKKEPRLWLGGFAIESLAEAFEPKPLELKDAELPRVVPRPGGFWLSWVRSLPEPKKAVKPPKEAGPASDPEERDILEMGLRALEVAKLDEQGNLQGSPLRVGEPRRQVLLYDVAPTASGSLLIAARSDSAVPGAEGGALLLSEVSADGSVREERLEDDEIGAGAPRLLVDTAQSMPWLVVSAPNDATRLGPLRGAQTSLQSDSLLGRAEVIAVSGGRFLAQRARGRQVQLEALACSWPAEKK
jgi:hypothetical protein